MKVAGQTADLTVFVPAYTQAAHPTYAAVTFLLLDQALGEDDVETRIGPVNVLSKGPGPDGRAGHRLVGLQTKVLAKTIRSDR